METIAWNVSILTMFVLLVQEGIDSVLHEVLKRNATCDQRLQILEFPLSDRLEHLSMDAVVRKNPWPHCKKSATPEQDNLEAYL